MNIVIVGGLLGGFLTSWLAPKAIAWYFDPPVNIGVNCRAATEWSMRNLQRAQFVGLAIGAILSLVVAVYFEKRRNGPPAQSTKV